MDSVKRLQSIIQQRLWVRNSIKMGRMQCAKLIIIKGEPILIISSDVTHEPLWARVERLQVINGEITVFYDGQYCEKLKMDEYEEYREYLNEDEWNILFEEDTTAKLEVMNLISHKDGFNLDIYINMDNYEDEFDKEESQKLNEEFNLLQNILMA